MRFLSDAPAVVLSPHLDDAVLGCWSVLTGPVDVLVVNVFDGVPPAGSVTLWELITGCTDSAEAIDKRLETAEIELASQGDFDHLVVNDDLGRAAAELERVVRDDLGLAPTV